MFESAEPGHKIGKAHWKKEIPGVREGLLDAQLDLFQAQKFPVIIPVAGVDCAGMPGGARKMSAEPLTALLRFPLLLVLLLLWGGCATAPDAAVPVETPVPVVPLPALSRVLGEATVYVSAGGERVQVVHDSAAGIVIVRLPDGGTAVLPEEIAGSEGRYRDSRMTVWENDGGLLLWVDGKLVFSGRVAK